MGGPASPRAHASSASLWLRRLLFLLAALAGYRCFLWAVVGLLYDEKQLQQRLEEWAHTNLTADVDTAKITVGVNAAAMVKMNAHGLVIASPNPLFPRDLLRSDPISIFCPLWGLWGIACQPRIELNNPLLSCEWGTTDRGCSLDGLADYRHSGVAPRPFPLAGVRPATIAIDIKGGKIILQRSAPPASLEMSLESKNFICDLRKAKAHGALQPSQLIFRGGENHEPQRALLHIDRFTLRPTATADAFPLALSELRLKTSGLPVKCLSILWPEMPPFDVADRFSGVVYLEDGRLEIAGELTSSLNAVLGLTPTAPLRIRQIIAGAEAGATIFLGREAEATAKIEKPAAGQSPQAALRCRRLDLRNLPEAAAQAWLDWLRWLGRRDWRLAISADALFCYFLAIREAQVDALLNENGCRSLIAQGKLAGGTCRLQATSLPPGRRLPDNFTCEVEAAEAAEWLTMLAPWLPPALQVKANSGWVAFSFRRSASKRAGESPLAAACNFTALAISAADAGALWREIFSLPSRLLSAEALIRKARSQAPPLERKNDLSHLRFSELTILANSGEDGICTLEINGRSEELGRLDGLGRIEADGVLRGALTLRELPPELVALASLEADTRQALARQMEDGLRLDFTLRQGEATIEHRYVQDIFRVWAEQTGSGEKEPSP